MAWFVPVALAAIQAGTAIYQGIKGAKRKREARALQAQADQQERANLSEANRQALIGMPEAEYQQALRNIYNQQSLGLSALKDRRSALAGVSSLQQSTNDALIRLSAEDARQRRSAEINALNQGNRIAGMTGNRAAETRYTGEALTGAAFQNFANAASTAATAISGGGNTFGSSSGSGTGVSSNGLSNNGYNYNAFSPNSGSNNSILWGPNGYRGFNTNWNPYAKPY